MLFQLITFIQLLGFRRGARRRLSAWCYERTELWTFTSLVTGLGSARMTSYTYHSHIALLVSFDSRTHAQVIVMGRGDTRTTKGKRMR